MNFDKIQLSSTASSLKILQQGSGSFTVPALPGAGSISGSATILHSYSSDNLLFQAAFDGATTNGVVIPWESNDGRTTAYGRIDSTALYLFCISSDASGGGSPSFVITYSYRILIP